MKIRNLRSVLLLALIFGACSEVIEPDPIDLLTDDTVLNEAADVPGVELGMYTAFRAVVPAVVIAGDATADMLIHHGTFTQFRELCNKEITSANGEATYLWASIYNAIYLTNFVLEKLPDVPSVKTVDRNRVLGTAHFLRAYSYFYALYTFGPVPKVTTTTLAANTDIPRATTQEILDLIQDDLDQALDELPETTVNPSFVGKAAANALSAKLNLYLGEWSKAEDFASDVINSDLFELDSPYQIIVQTDFPKESIFEVAYAITDDPGTDNNIGLNSLFVGRREIIPSNETVLALNSPESGARSSTITFDPTFLQGSDNGWAVAKYGTQDENNNNVIALRLGEMYLIRSEARAQQSKITGASGALADLNVLRYRAKASLVSSASQSAMLQLIEKERLYELAYEGDRWYDLVRTGRAQAVISAFTSNWKDTYDLWPIPQRELLYNPALAGNQNPGY